MLPLINKIRNRKLILKDYTLNSGHCLALAEVWTTLGKPELDVCFFDNCGIDDEEFASLLEGFYALNDLKLLYYKENVLNALAIESMKPILQKRFPINLRQLKLVKLQTSDIFINDLLDFLTNNPSNLYCLSLV